MSATFAGLIPAFAWGMVLGALFLAGLWVTVRRLEHSARPGLLMVASYVARMLIVLFGFYLLSNGDWRNLVAALAGFTLIRILAVRRLARPGHPPGTTQGAC